MEFIRKLKELKGPQFITTDKKHRMRMFDTIKFNNGNSLSIQASSFHYSTPRLTLNKHRYTHMEVAILFGNHFQNLNQLGNLHKYWADGVYAYMPIKDIETVYQYLKQEHGLKKKD